MTTPTISTAWTLEAVTAWREAALADGWTQSQTYAGWPVEQRATLTRDGWIALVSADGWASVAAYGPDRCVVRVPTVYSWEALQEEQLICSECFTRGPTVRLVFATRVCPDCRTRLRLVSIFAEHNLEEPGA